jgi:hypothetical protein
MSEWVRLEEGNDWGQIYYALPGKRLIGGMADARRGVTLTDGRLYKVRCPDGSVARRKMCTKRTIERISDHGHYTDVTQTRYGFVIEARGIKTWVEVNAIELLASEVA